MLHRSAIEMKNILVVGVVLLVLGIAVLLYGQFNYRSRETVLKIGPVEATAETTKRVPLPPVLGWVLIGGGVAALIVSVRNKA